MTDTRIDFETLPDRPTDCRARIILLEEAIGGCQRDLAEQWRYEADGSPWTEERYNLWRRNCLAALSHKTRQLANHRAHLLALTGESGPADDAADLAYGPNNRPAPPSAAIHRPSPNRIARVDRDNEEAAADLRDVTAELLALIDNRLDFNDLLDSELDMIDEARELCGLN